MYCVAAADASVGVAFFFAALLSNQLFSVKKFFVKSWANKKVRDGKELFLQCLFEKKQKKKKWVIQKRKSKQQKGEKNSI